jgi:hypothetical protein
MWNRVKGSGAIFVLMEVCFKRKSNIGFVVPANV